ncbi:MAG TPA: type I secretion protein, partial [Cyanobacteria bacterium UBA11049]|nr:type I secretion protein [Cyanobacteria bacterium UBA11049]
TSQFVIGATAATAEHRFIYNNFTGALFFDDDGTGATVQVQFAQLTDGLAFTANNIVVG